MNANMVKCVKLATVITGACELGGVDDDTGVCQLREPVSSRNRGNQSRRNPRLIRFLAPAGGEWSR